MFLKSMLLGTVMFFGLAVGQASALTVTVPPTGNVGALDLGVNTIQGTGSGSCFESVPGESGSVVCTDDGYYTFGLDLPGGLILTSVVGELVNWSGTFSGIAFSDTASSIILTNLNSLSSTGNILVSTLIGPLSNLPSVGGGYRVNGIGNSVLGSYTFDWKMTFTTENSSVVPLPAALPLFAAGLSAMGFMGWRRKRKAAA